MIFRILLLCIALALVGTSFWLLYRRKSDPKNGDKTPTSSKAAYPKRFITPKEFTVGLMDTPGCNPANLCGAKILYPLNNPDVDYGSKMPEGCPCAQFLESP